MDVIKDLDLPPCAVDLGKIRGNVKYYHYCIDGVNDQGWGCGYRTLQTILSWINNQIQDLKSAEVPSIKDIQQALVELGDKNESFVGSKTWIGSIEVAYCLDFFHQIPCKIIHVSKNSDFDAHASDILEHFNKFGSPIMMGGDVDCSSKCLLGICSGAHSTYLLILDPHFAGTAIKKEKLKADGWIKWVSSDTLIENSFYNLCCPQLKAKDSEETLLVL